MHYRLIKHLFIYFLFLILAIAHPIFGQNDVFIGISYSPSQDTNQIELTQIVKHSPASISGLEVGDILLSIDEVSITSRESLGDFLETKSPGDRVKLNILRCKKELKIDLILGKRSDFLISMKSGGRETFPVDADSIIPHWRQDSIVSIFLNGIHEADLDTIYNKLTSSFRTEFENYSGFYTLDHVAAVMLDPASCLPSASDVIEKISIDHKTPSNFLRGTFDILDLGTPDTLSRFTISSLDKLIAVIERANSLVDSAFLGLSTDELQEVADHIPFLLETFCQTVYIHNDENEELVDGYYKLIESTKKIDYEKLLSAGELICSLYDMDLQGILSGFSGGEGADIEKDILLDKQIIVSTIDSSGQGSSVFARMIITGRKGMTYSQEAAIWIDLGGDDTYLGFSGGTPYTIYDNTTHKFATGRVGLHIDLGGNDKYIRNTPGGIGAGLCGIGCLIDLQGNDLYSGSRLTQGSSFCGIGILIDDDGSDTYLAQECAQGFAAFGMGLLFDKAGNDIYTGARYCQGVGLTKALGALIDVSGNDRYIASFKHPNGYGNENSWDGWSQGVGMGFRSVSAGGIGVLCDRAGNDHYEAGNFSQACGYFFGMGILDDIGGNDVYIGNRYVQGAGAHQACAVFRDHSGNDLYTGNEAVNQGGAWDIVSAWFIDDSGDDEYNGTSLSQGGASQSALAVCIDLDGTDIYRSTGTSNGSGGGLDYHGDYDDRNIGAQIDLGDHIDDYSKTGGKRKNNKIILPDDDDKKETGDGFFIDR
ncbi:PDZ domain-containing protein [bacterium]|nr:PDZ domain-containing protein [bacterium]